MAQRRYHHQPAQVLPFQPAVDGPSVLEAPQKEDSLTCRQKASLLAIFLGALGVHKFYLGHLAEGCVHITLTLASLAAAFVVDSWLPLVVVMLFSAIEGVSYVSRSEEQFVRDYLEERRRWL